MKDNFGCAEFTLKCEPKYVELVIHGNHVVAKAKKDVYEKIFDYAIKQLGGRIDGLS
jgi:hypothetical protein